MHHGKADSKEVSILITNSFHHSQPENQRREGKGQGENEGIEGERRRKKKKRWRRNKRRRKTPPALQGNKMLLLIASSPKADPWGIGGKEIKTHMTELFKMIKEKKKINKW